MIYESTKAISRALTQKGICHDVSETAHGSVLCVRFRTNNAGELHLRILSVGDHSDVAMYICPLLTVPEHRRGFALEIVNKLNQQFRHLRFSLDADNEVQVVCDLPVGCANLGEVACEMCLHMAKTADQAFLSFVTPCF